MERQIMQDLFRVYAERYIGSTPQIKRSEADFQNAIEHLCEDDKEKLDKVTGGMMAAYEENGWMSGFTYATQLLSEASIKLEKLY